MSSPPARTPQVDRIYVPIIDEYCKKHLYVSISYISQTTM
jgi:hypothetical protein